MNYLSKFEAELDDILPNANGGRIRMFSEVYSLICKQEQPSLALRCFFDKMDALQEAEESDEQDDSTELELMLFEYQCGTLVEGILDKLISDRMDVDDFYCALWNEIQEGKYFRQEKEKIYAIYEIWTDGRIPYYKIAEGIKMGNEEFSEIIRKNIDPIKEIIFILNSKFAQRTERSGSLIKILDSLETEKDKAVILAQILALIEKHAYLKGVHTME